MVASASQLSLAFLAAASLLGLAAGLTAFPCHAGKERMGDGVACKRIEIPKGLCTKCPLRPANPKGLFLNCADIFDTASPGCLEKMEEYTAANPCDKKRGDAMKALRKNEKDKNAIGVVDYFLYSACEQCCDCIPMGSNQRLFGTYAKSHTTANPTLYDARRGNCPAHAKYDICKVAPKVTHFAAVGDPPVAGANKLPAVCPLLDAWEKSKEGRGWQENPETTLVAPLVVFLNGMLDKLGCANKGIWDRCYALESSQDHLGVPEAVPEVPAKEPVESIEPGASPSTSPVDAIPNPGDTSDAIGADPSADPVLPPASTCFPGRAKVDVRGRGRIAMEQLRIGDEVLAGPGRYSPVFVFSHRDASFRATHLRIGMSDGGALTLTPGHHLPVNGVHAPASSVIRGDTLDGVDGPLTVTSVSRVVERGLYNPHTIAGTVVVDGVVCSTYTEAVRPSAAQALLSPLRALFRVGGVSEEMAGGFLRHGGGGVPSALCLS